MCLLAFQLRCSELFFQEIVIGVDELYSFGCDLIHFSHSPLLNLSLASEEAFDLKRVEEGV